MSRIVTHTPAPGALRCEATCRAHRADCGLHLVYIGYREVARRHSGAVRRPYTFHCAVWNEGREVERSRRLADVRQMLVIITDPVSIRRLIVARSRRSSATMCSGGARSTSGSGERTPQRQPTGPLRGSASRAIRSDGRTFAPLAMGERDRDIARSGSGTNAAPATGKDATCTATALDVTVGMGRWWQREKDGHRGARSTP